MAESKVNRENYNAKFKRHYGIKFDKKYIVHHIDENRGNNDISNLMVLPRGLHSKYHILKRIIDNNRLPTTINGNQANNRTMLSNYYERFLEVLNECNKWHDFKMYLDGKLPNIHGIVL